MESVVSLPRHSAYSATKHAVDGFLDGLRRDLIADGEPISVTTIRPGTIDTPFFEHAVNTMDVLPTGALPVYQPAVVADCVVYAAEHPVRDLWAGGSARLLAVLQSLSPRLVDALASRLAPLERSDEPAPGGSPGALFSPREDEDRTEGDLDGSARDFSTYTWLQTHAWARPVLVAGALAGTMLVAGRRWVR